MSPNILAIRHSLMRLNAVFTDGDRLADRLNAVLDMSTDERI